MPNTQGKETLKQIFDSLQNDIEDIKTFKKSFQTSLSFYFIAKNII